MEITSITFFPRHTRLSVRFRHHLYSSQIPGLDNLLFSMLPLLREHICHNRHGLGFVEEVLDTEMGHVFEHVMLAILQTQGLFLRGQTTWNWQRDPIGTYHVTINTGKKLLLKQSLVVAQAIFTNALTTPVLRFALAGDSPGKVALQVTNGKEPPRLLFSADKSDLASQQS